MSRQRRCFYCVLGGCKVILKFILYFQTLSHTHTESSYKQTSCLSYISIEIGHFRFESREISYSHTELIEFETMITTATTTTLWTVNRTKYTDVKDLDLRNHRKNQKNEIQSQKNNKQSHPSAIEWKNNVFRFLFLTFLVYYYVVAIVVVGDDCATRNKIQQPTRFFFLVGNMFIFVLFLLLLKIINNCTHTQTHAHIHKYVCGKHNCFFYRYCFFLFNILVNTFNNLSTFNFVLFLRSQTALSYVFMFQRASGRKVSVAFSIDVEDLMITMTMTMILYRWEEW